MAILPTKCLPSDVGIGRCRFPKKNEFEQRVNFGVKQKVDMQNLVPERHPRIPMGQFLPQPDLTPIDLRCAIGAKKLDDIKKNLRQRPLYAPIHL